MNKGKVCSECGKWKDFDGFTKHKGFKDGLLNKCKECNKQYYLKNAEVIKQRSRQYALENEEKVKRYKKKHYEQNIDIYKQRHKRYQEENKERISRRKKQYQEENLEAIKKYQQKYRQENKEFLKCNKKKYYEENKEEIIQQNKQYYEKNKETISQQRKQYRKFYSQTEKGKETNYRRTLKRRSYKHKVSFKLHERKRILDRDKWICQSCGIKVHDKSTGDWNTPDKAHIDHIIPISKGGNSEPNNLRVLCRTCNLSKQDKMDEQLQLFI